ncbi:MAG: hypothetical protein IJI45_06680 [Anaerolineaceae bacterium]|nr:hypothetical protein [Anaerolineaceae bacterium]
MIRFEELFRHGCADVVSVQGRPYLFTNMRVDRKTVSDELFAYDVRDGDCDGEFWQIQRFVMVNHWGTIIGKERVDMPDFDGSAYLCPPDPEDENISSEGSFIGSVSSEREYLDRYRQLKALC